MILYKPGFKFFLLWLAICAAVFYFLNASAGIWGFLIYCFMGSHEESSTINSKTKKFNNDNFLPSSTYLGEVNYTNEHKGTSYNTGDITQYSDGSSSVRSGEVTYFSHGIRSVQSGNVTYYFDGNNRELGRSVDNGNGVHTYFDVNNREIGHSYTTGRITDFVGNCFEL